MRHLRDLPTAPSSPVCVMEQVLGQSASARGLTLYLLPSTGRPMTPVRPCAGRDPCAAAVRRRYARFAPLAVARDRCTYGRPRALDAGPRRRSRMVRSLSITTAPAWCCSRVSSSPRWWCCSCARRSSTRTVCFAPTRRSPRSRTRTLLTGLDNRRAFNERLAAASPRAAGKGSSFALLYFDLDHFKDVNDTLGHPIGDMLLAQRWRRASARCYAATTWWRGSAATNSSCCSPMPTKAWPRRLRRDHRTLRRSFLIQGNEVHVAASIGIARCTSETSTSDMLIVQADLALYRAKEDGHNCFPLPQ